MKDEAARKTLGTLLSWMVQSANTPIRPDEATKLLEMLNPPDEAAFPSCAEATEKGEL